MSEYKEYQREEESINSYKEEKKIGLCCHIILALLISPVAVYMSRGATCQLWTNIALFILLGFPGIIHALVLVCIFLTKLVEKKNVLKSSICQSFLDRSLTNY